MPEMTIRLRCDPTTGKKDIVISLSADADSLPHEHEQMHQQLVDKLIHGGILKASEVGKIVVEREEEEGESGPPVSSPQETERRSVAEGQ